MKIGNIAESIKAVSTMAIPISMPTEECAACHGQYGQNCTERCNGQDCTRPMKDGNFVFMNAVYFGSSDISRLKALSDGVEAIDECLRLTNQVVTQIFCPKIVICLSVNEVFDPLARKCEFREIETLHPINGTQYVSSKAVKRAWWGSCRVIGIPYPSQAISYDDLGSIALFIKQELTRE